MVTLLVPKDAPGERRYLTLAATSLKDESASDEARIFTTILPPPPERVGGTLSRQVPVSMSLSGSGSITKEDYSAWGGFDAGGDLSRGRWVNVSVGVPYEKEELEKGEVKELDYALNIIPSNLFY